MQTALTTSTLETFLPVPMLPDVNAMLALSTRTHAFLADIQAVDIDSATLLMMKERGTEILGRYYSPFKAPTRLQRVVLSDMRTPVDFVTASCKHACAIIK